MIRKGYSQSDRKQEMLNPEYFKIDDRNLSEFVEFVLRFSEIVPFYNSENSLDGNWLTFFNKDFTILLIRIAAIDIKEYETKFETIINQEKTIDWNATQCFKFIFDIFSTIETWNQKTSGRGEFNTEIKKLISYKFSNLATKLFILKKAALLEQLIIPFQDTYNFQSGIDWDIDIQNNEPFFFSGKAPEENQNELFKILNNIFYILLENLKLIIESAEIYKNQKLFQSQDNQPHIALLFAFFEIYKEAQYEINLFTKRHLNYYFQEILKFTKIPFIPDKVHILAEIQDNIENCLIPKNTELLAGTDPDGNELIYKTDDELVINQSTIENIKAIINDDKTPDFNCPNFIQTVFLDHDINSGIKELDSEPQATLGFAIASSFLKLEEGDRHIQIIIEFQRYFFEEFEKIVQTNIIENVAFDIYSLNDIAKDLFILSYSVAETEQISWYTIPNSIVKTSFIKNSDGIYTNKMLFSIELNSVHPPFYFCENEKYTEAKQRELPVLRCLINPEKILLYNYLKNLRIEKIVLSVDVHGVKNLKLQNDFGVIDSSQPFAPFGPIPTIGSNFYIGHNTIFSQPLDELHINFDWYDVPLLEDGFKEYYKAYSYIDSNDVFKAKLYALYNKNWIPADKQQVINLFEDEILEEQPETPVNNFRIIDNIDLNRINYPFKNKPAIVNKDLFFNNISRNGYLRLEFCFPPNGFGHKEYPEIVKNQMSGSIKRKEIPVPPNEPWTPQLRSVSVNYSSKLIIDFNKQEPKNRSFFYHLMPFGELAVSENITNDLFFLPVYGKGSEIYIGLNNLTKLQTLTFLFVISDYTNGNLSEKICTQWSFLNKNEWIQLREDQIISDTTADLTTTGIIKLDLAGYDEEFFNAESLTNNKTLPTGLLWLKIKSNLGAKMLQNIHYINSNAVRATFANNNNNLNHLINGLPANTITNFVQEIENVKAIHQPHKSFGGIFEETEEKFYTRVSERLRHKNRAITNWDFEHLVLQNFPEVFHIVCLNNLDSNLKEVPGNLTIVIIPFLSNFQKISEPKFSLNKLEKIKNFLQQRCSVFTKINTINPIYEKILVKCDIKFHKGYNEKFYQKQVNQDLKKLLSPWIYEEGINLNFSNEIYAAHILYFLESQDYIDYITNFAVYQIENNIITNFNEAANNDLIIKPSTPVTIFTSADNHLISIVGETKQLDTIESMSIETDFIIQKEIKTDKPTDGIEQELIAIDFMVSGSQIEYKEETPDEIHINFFIPE